MQCAFSLYNVYLDVILHYKYLFDERWLLALLTRPDALFLCFEALACCSSSDESVLQAFDLLSTMDTFRGVRPPEVVFEAVF